MLTKQYIFYLCFCLVLAGCKTEKETNSNQKSSELMIDHFAENGFGNAVAIVQHPAGVYHQGITYVCYQGPLEDPYVASYNHQTDEWKGPFKAGVSEMGKDPNRKKKIDNHGKPSIIIDDAGYIHIAFGGHGGMRKHGENKLGNHHYGKNLHAVSKKPLDISSWETLNNISVFGTYNQFIKMDNGDIYLFYRHGAHRSNWVYQKSTDNGRTFNEPVSFLKHKRRTDMQAEDSWYPWITKGKGDDLIVVFDYHLCRDARNNQDKRGHIPERHNVYYMVMDTKTDTWKNVKGESLNMPLIREEADEKALVTKTGSDWTFQGVADLNLDGNPHVCIRVGADTGKRRSAPKSLHHFRWNGVEWVQSKNAQLPVGGGDIEVNSNNNVNIYLDDSGAGEISRWDSFDAGDTFKKGAVLLHRNNSGFAISSLIDNPHPDARMIVAEKESGTYFRKIYLLGDNGSVQRSKKEVQLLKE
ncbi:MAG: BNR-4 repeat-containing protein [Saprospiraceae bacterium]